MPDVPEPESAFNFTGALLISYQFQFYNLCLIISENFCAKNISIIPRSRAAAHRGRGRGERGDGDHHAEGLFDPQLNVILLIVLFYEIDSGRKDPPDHCYEITGFIYILGK